MSDNSHYEIQTCLNCPLPECKPTINDCPLKAAESELKKNVYWFIERHAPTTKQAIIEFFKIDKKKTARILDLLRKRNLIITNENREIILK